MNLKKSIKYLQIFVIIFIFLIIQFNAASLPPVPGLPHRFKGSVLYDNGDMVSTGKVLAVVNNQQYTTDIIDGTYGVYYPFYVENPYSDNDNTGITINFYVNLSGELINTNHEEFFVPLGLTDLNLTIKYTEDNNNGNNGGSGGISAQDNEPQNIGPIADAGGSYYGSVNKSILFNASNSYDSDGEIISYQWTFGDEESGSGVIVSHNYSKLGVYNITLLVEDDDGLYDTDKTTVTIFIDKDNDGWSDEEEEGYNTDPENSSDYPKDTDNDHIPDFLDEDDDNDGLSDILEEDLSLDPKNTTLSEMIVINGVHYLIDTNNDGNFDIFYNSTKKINTNITKNSDYLYLIDDDGDGKWDYFYNVSTSQLSIWSDNDENNDNIFINLTIVVIIIILILMLFLVYRYNKNKKIKDK